MNRISNNTEYDQGIRQIIQKNEFVTTTQDKQCFEMEMEKPTKAELIVSPNFEKVEKRVIQLRAYGKNLQF